MFVSHLFTADVTWGLVTITVYCPEGFNIVLTWLLIAISTMLNYAFIICCFIQLLVIICWFLPL